MANILLISESVIYSVEGKVYARGGGEVSVHKFAKVYHSLGFNVTVLGMNEQYQKLNQLIEGINYQYYNVSNRKSFTDVFRFLNYSHKFSRNFEYVCLNQFTPHLLLFFSIKRKQKKIVLIHDIYNSLKIWIRTFGFFVGLLGYIVEKLMLFSDENFANKVVVVSEATKNKLKFSKNVYVIPNYIECPKFNDIKVSEDNFILFVGRFVDYKRPSDVLIVFSSLLKLDRNLKAVFIASRVEDSVMKLFLNDLKKLKIESKVVMITKTISSDEVYSYMKKARLLIHPSVIEGQGLVVYESILLGTPVVAYALDAYIKDLKSLYLVPIGNTHELAAAAKFAIADNQKSDLVTHSHLPDFNFVKNKLKEMLEV